MGSLIYYRPRSWTKLTIPRIICILICIIGTRRKFPHTKHILSMSFPLYYFTLSGYQFPTFSVLTLNWPYHKSLLYPSKKNKTLSTRTWRLIIQFISLWFPIVYRLYFSNFYLSLGNDEDQGKTFYQYIVHLCTLI